jgi:hypothetical protein
MSTTKEAERTVSADQRWEAGAVAGIAGAAVMAALVLLMNPPTLTVAIPSLYGLAPPASGAAGLVVHLSHGAVLGVVFAGLAEAADLDSLPSLLGAGAAWGVLTWVGFAAVVMPVWLSAVGSPASPPLPNFAPPSLLWHLVYGVVLGGVDAVSRDWF